MASLASLRSFRRRTILPLFLTQALLRAQLDPSLHLNSLLVISWFNSSIIFCPRDSAVVIPPALRLWFRSRAFWMTLWKISSCSYNRWVTRRRITYPFLLGQVPTWRLLSSFGIMYRSIAIFSPCLTMSVNVTMLATSPTTSAMIEVVMYLRVWSKRVKFPNYLQKPGGIMWESPLLIIKARRTVTHKVVLK
jgi:hypothetical protein